MRRARLEMDIEVANKERLEQRCYTERVNQQTLFRWASGGRSTMTQLNPCACELPCHRIAQRRSSSRPDGAAACGCGGGSMLC